MAVSPTLWSPSARGTNPLDLLTTQLDGFTTTQYSAAGSAIDNDTAGIFDLLVDLTLNISYASVPTAGSSIDVFQICQDGAGNYEDGGSTFAPPSGPCASFPLRAVTGAQRIVMRKIEVPPYDHKYMAVANTTGQTAAANSNTLKGFFYRLGNG